MYLPGIFFDPTMLIIIPGIIIASIAQMKINMAYETYSRVANSKGLVGAEVAKDLLRIAGISDVSVEMVRGRLSDHYDPSKKVVRLSQSVYCGNSVASLSVAAHEVGHAIQHHYGYIPLTIRSSIAPVVNFSSKASWILITIGLIFGFMSNSLILLQIGIVLFTVVVIFQLITLPVEFNASKRALEMLEEYSFLQKNEINGSKKVLGAAALTYVAAALTGILQLIRLLVIFNNRDD
ncbi:zinc metallopeptidase [uncultured Tyzzerella sp.]|uniref:zinc metallopeptidase n=1 Tax=uncultured Tyzzerella sp. TaxID=2321398 RepID=UPI0029425E6A|nr:zinc metallopeptidase [uncultured Tyzzerella sp.]